MAFDIGVLGDDYRFLRELHLNSVAQGALFRKLVTLDDYPCLGRAKDDKEDVIFRPDDVPCLLVDAVRLEAYLKGEKKMSDEVKARCLEFVSKLREMCELAQKEGRSVDFIAGE